MTNLNDYDLADEAAASRKEHGEREMRPAVRRVFAKYDMPHHSGGKPTTRYRHVMQILSARGHKKAIRMKEQRHFTTPTQAHEPVGGKGTLFEGHVSPPHRF